MNDWFVWLERVAEQPLPGAMTVAALSAAMGAALLSKAIRVTLTRQDLPPVERAALESAAALVPEQRAELLRLADADEVAFRRVLEARRLPPKDLERRRAWQAAADVPLRIAEVCHLLLEPLPTLQDWCWPPVQVEMRVAIGLIETGRETGLLAAKYNLDTWGTDPMAVPFQARLKDLEAKK